jgi:hypothetical protein
MINSIFPVWFLLIRVAESALLTPKHIPSSTISMFRLDLIILGYIWLSDHTAGFMVHNQVAPFEKEYNIGQS